SKSAIVAHVVVAPRVTANSADLAINATSFTITGSGFDPTGTNTVALNLGASVASVVVDSATQLTVTFGDPPSFAGLLTATVTTDGIASNTAQVATIRPTVTTNDTDVSGVTTSFTITGTGFDTTSSHNTVVLSSGTVTSVVANSSTQLVVTLDAPPSPGT